MRVIASQLGNPTGKRGIEMGIEMHEKNFFMIQSTIDQLALRSGSQVLELGHGSALHLPYLMAKANNMVYHGLEISETMKNSAITGNEKEDYADQIDFEIYDGLKIPFVDSCFDRVFTVNTVYFWGNPSLMASELGRVLKPAGILGITFANRDFMQLLPFTQFGFELYDAEDIVSLMEKAGLKTHHIEEREEEVLSSAGEKASRKFTVMTFIKD